MLRTSRGRVEASFCRCRAARVGIRAQGLLGASGTAEHGAIGGGGGWPTEHEHGSIDIRYHESVEDGSVRAIPNPVGRRPLVGGGVSWEQARSTAIPI
jgi:hypothetical protein